MITDVGKTIVNVPLINGVFIRMFNNTISGAYSSYQFVEENGNVRYSMILDNSVAGMNYRSLHFTRSNASSPINSNPLPVVFIPNTEITDKFNITVQPLFEVISPSVFSPATGTYQLTWWSNVSDYSSLVWNSEISTNQCVYDWTKLKLFSTDTRGEEEYNGACAKILCTARIVFENLQIQSGSVILDTFQLYPVVKDAIIVAVVPNEGYITDFSGGGDGSMKRHAHTSTDDCGFAAAVYMPSALMKPFSWK